MDFRTSLTNPLQIYRLNTPAAGDIGLTFCPGKYDAHAMTGAWSRALGLDLGAIRDWPAHALLTLMEAHELDLLRVPTLGEEALGLGLEWTHLPIVDGSIPSAAFESQWADAAERLLGHLEAGSNVVIHCRGGLGRTGLLAGMLLVDLGVEPGEALRQVRAVRPAAVETEEQEQYLLSYRGSRGVRH